MVALIFNFWQGIAAILLVSSISAFISTKIGIFISFSITLVSIALVMLIGTVAAAGYDEYIPFGLFVFPGLSWVGFFAGYFFRRNKKFGDR